MVEETKVCIKCNIERPLIDFEFRKDTQKYRNVCKKCRYLQKYKMDGRSTKEDINKKRRELYQKNKDEINAKRRLEYKERKPEEDIKIKIKKQLKRALDKSFTRKGLKRRKTYEELLCCNIDEAVIYLLDGYQKRYEKKLTINDEVDIDHILSLWSAYKQESIEKLCCYKNLRLLSKRDNHNRKYKITKEEGQLIKEYFDFLHKSEKCKNNKM